MSALVHTNDPVRPVLEVVISGEVKEFLRMKPRFVSMKGTVGESLAVTVEIIPVHPFKITGMQIRPNKNVRVSLEENQKGQRLSYQLMVENTANTPGRYYERIELRTDSDIRPVLRIPVRGNILKKQDLTSIGKNQ